MAANNFPNSNPNFDQEDDSTAEKVVSTFTQTIHELLIHIFLLEENVKNAQKPTGF
jgi:hypothetical protein